MTASSFAADTPIVVSQSNPNILWITAEDMSPTLGCYGDDYATTPHIDQFATEGVLYTTPLPRPPFVRHRAPVS